MPESHSETDAAPPPAGVRLDWYDVPEAVRDAITAPLGAAAINAETVTVGFSPGVAARLQLANGRSAFVKVVSSDQNPDSPTMHRAEARVAAALPATGFAPRLLSAYDDGHWVALVFEHIDGRQPGSPWTEDDLTLVVDAVAAMHRACTPSPVSVPTVQEHLADAFCGWRTLAAAPPASLDGWSAGRLPALAELEAGWPDAADGDTLLHCDLRADNLLLSGGRVVLVDWPWACTGAGWLDVVFLAPSVEMQGGPRPEDVLVRYPHQPSVDSLLRVVAALAGLFTERSLRPPPQGLPTVRAFQAAQGVVARRWLDRLLGTAG